MLVAFVLAEVPVASQKAFVVQQGQKDHLLVVQVQGLVEQTRQGS
jgi:hypothetical protein